MKETELKIVKPKLDERFFVKVQGKEFVTYSGLLDLAHQRGLQKLNVKPIQYPTKENGMEAICQAVAESKDGAIFSDIGDANPSNVAAMVAKHILRMASTRAKARVLRDFVNIGMTALEELDFDGVNENNLRDDGHQQQRQQKQPPVKPNSNGSSKKNGNGKITSQWLFTQFNNLDFVKRDKEYGNLYKLYCYNKYGVKSMTKLNDEQLIDQNKILGTLRNDSQWIPKFMVKLDSFRELSKENNKQNEQII